MRADVQTATIIAPAEQAPLVEAVRSDPGRLGADRGGCRSWPAPAR